MVVLYKFSIRARNCTMKFTVQFQREIMDTQALLPNIKRVIREYGRPMKAKDIAKQIGQTKTTVNQALYKYGNAEGLFITEEFTWALSPSPSPGAIPKDTKRAKVHNKSAGIMDINNNDIMSNVLGGLDTCRDKVVAMSTSKTMRDAANSSALEQWLRSEFVSDPPSDISRVAYARECAKLNAIKHPFAIIVSVPLQMTHMIKKEFDEIGQTDKVVGRWYVWDMDGPASDGWAYERASGYGEQDIAEMIGGMLDSGPYDTEEAAAREAAKSNNKRVSDENERALKDLIYDNQFLVEEILRCLYDGKIYVNEDEAEEIVREGLPDNDTITTILKRYGHLQFGDFLKNAIWPIICDAAENIASIPFDDGYCSGYSCDEEDEDHVVGLNLEKKRLRETFDAHLPFKKIMNTMRKMPYAVSLMKDYLWDIKQ